MLLQRSATARSTVPEYHFVWNSLETYRKTYLSCQTMFLLLGGYNKRGHSQWLFWNGRTSRCKAQAHIHRQRWKWMVFWVCFWFIVNISLLLVFSDLLLDWLTGCLPACLPAYLLACLPACLPAYLTNWLNDLMTACLPACLPACMPACLPA